MFSYCIDCLNRYWGLISVMVLAVISVLSLLPLSSSAGVPGSDKVGHLLAYALLALPASLRKPRGWICLLIAFIVWSGVIELIQPMVNRYAEWLDFAFNMLGILFGAGLAQVLAYINKKV